MTREQIIKHFGSIKNAAESLGYTRFAIWKWRKGIPLRTQLVIEKITDGALKAARK